MVGSDVFPTEIICPFFRGHSLVFRGVLKRNGYERPHEGSCFFFLGGGGTGEPKCLSGIFELGDHVKRAWPRMHGTQNLKLG